MDILVLTKTAKMVATRHTSLPQNIPKCFGGWGSAPDPTGETQRSPDLLALLGDRVLAEKGKEDKKMEGGKENGDYGRGGEGIGPKKGELRLPPRHCWLATSLAPLIHLGCAYRLIL